MLQLFNASPKIRGPPLKNFTPAKFLVDFTQLPTFIANISGTRQDSKNRKDVISSNSSRVQANKSGELWSTIHRVVHVVQSSTKSTFFDRLYFGPYRVLALEIFTRPTVWPSLVSAHRIRGRGSP